MRITLLSNSVFAAEGLDVFFDWKTFRGTQSSWKELAYFERPQDKPYAEGRDVIQGACAWGSICSRVPAGGWGMQVVPEQIVTTGPCGYTAPGVLRLARGLAR